MKKCILVILSCAIIALMVGFCGFLLAINILPLRSFFSTRTWVKFRFGQEVHLDVENTTSCSYMIIVLYKNKTEVFTVEPESHSVYIPKFRLSQKDVSLEVRILESNDVDKSNDEVYFVLDKNEGLYPYTNWGDFEANFIIAPEGEGFCVTY